MSNNKRRVSTIIVLILILLLVVLLYGNTSLARFSDTTNQQTSKARAMAESLGPEFRPGQEWSVVLEGPKFFKSLCRSLLPQYLSKLSGSQAKVEFLTSLPDQQVKENLLYIQFSGKEFWLPFWTTYTDRAEWAFARDGKTDWIRSEITESFGPGLNIRGTIDNEGNGLGFLSLRASQRHRVALMLDRIASYLEEACQEIRQKASSSP